MKNVIAYIYLVIGFLAGFMLGILPRESSGFPLLKLGFFAIAIVIILSYVWFENTSHARHMSKWGKHRSRGRVYFIVSHYILGRAVPVLLIFMLPLASRVNFEGDSTRVLIFTAAIALIAFGLLGLHEWAQCQSDFSVQLLRDAAQRVKEGRPGFDGGSA